MEEEVVEAAPVNENGSNSGSEAPAAEPSVHEEEPEENKRQEAQPPVAPELVGRPKPSTRDTMIELHTKALLQTSATILAVSCFHNSQVLICNVDIKTRGKSIKSKIDNKQKPTCLY